MFNTFLRALLTGDTVGSLIFLVESLSRTFFNNCLFYNVRTVLLLPLFPPGLALLFRFLTVPVSTKPFNIFLTVFGVGSLTPGNSNWKSLRSCGMNCFFLSLSLLL